MNTTEETNRREFEGRFSHFDLSRNPLNGIYFDYGSEGAWQGWQAARERQWMPIETAPDITEILVFNDSFNTIWIATRLDGKWIDASDGRSINSPKFWMPLPNPPTSEKI